MGGNAVVPADCFHGGDLALRSEETIDRQLIRNRITCVALV